MQCGAVISGSDLPFGSSLAGSMVLAVDGTATQEKSFWETEVMITSSLEKGSVRLKLMRGINPGFCRTSACRDRTPITGSQDFTRCWISKGLQVCGEYCCCPSGYEYRSSFLLAQCSSC